MSYVEYSLANQQPLCEMSYDVFNVSYDRLYWCHVLMEYVYFATLVMALKW